MDIVTLDFEITDACHRYRLSPRSGVVQSLFVTGYELTAKFVYDIDRITYGLQLALDFFRM
jgi:hypothetical protein